MQWIHGANMDSPRFFYSTNIIHNSMGIFFHRLRAYVERWIWSRWYQKREKSASTIRHHQPYSWLNKVNIAYECIFSFTWNEFKMYDFRSEGIIHGALHTHTLHSSNSQCQRRRKLNEKKANLLTNKGTWSEKGNNNK